MFTSMKEAFLLYKDQFLRVLLIGISVVLPLQIIYTILVNYVSMPFYYFQIPLWSSFFQSVFMLIAVFIMMIPMISLVVQDTRMKEVRTRKLYLDTIKYGFFVYLISIPISILTTIGFLMLIIPGIILLVFCIGIPFVKVMEDESFKTVIKKSFSFGKENFLTICGLLLLFAAIDFIGTYLFSLIAIVMTENIAVTNWAFMALNIFLLPLFVFSIAKQYLDWSGEADVIHKDEYIQQLEQYR